MTLSECQKRKELLEKKAKNLSLQVENFKKQAGALAEALDTAKQGHRREEKLEDESMVRRVGLRSWQYSKILKWIPLALLIDVTEGGITMLVGDSQ